MKNLTVFLALSLFATQMAQAEEAEVVTRVLKDSTTLVGVDLNEKSVFCTDLGYSNVVLKVNVPDLDHLAHFDHRVASEGQPCIAAGACTGKLDPKTIIDPKEPVAVAPMRVILEETLTLDRAAGTCTRMLSERIVSHIRGVDFFHHKFSEPTQVSLAVCEKVRRL